MNKSTQDLDQTRTRLDKSDHENQSLREQLKRLGDKLNKRDEKVKNEKNKVNLRVDIFSYYWEICSRFKWNMLFVNSSCVLSCSRRVMIIILEIYMSSSVLFHQYHIIS